MMSNIGCMPLSILRQTNCPTQSMERRQKVLAHSFLAELSEKHNVSDAVFLANGSYSLQDACQRHSFEFRYEKHGNRNAVERVFREIKRLTNYFSNCFSNAEAETADDWLRSFSFAWNQLI
jgi:putative transposase